MISDSYVVSELEKSCVLDFINDWIGAWSPLEDLFGP